MNRFIILLLAAGLTACASTTVYAPAENSGALGYRQMRLEDDRYRVRFTGGSDVSFDRVADLALRRAAEITIENGHDWFAVTSRAAEGDDANPVRVGGALGRSWGSRGYSGTGVGLGVSFSPGAGRKAVMLEIVTGRGERPDDPQVYDAREVLENIIL